MAEITEDGSYWAIGCGAAHRSWKIVVVRGDVVYIPGALMPVDRSAIERWGNRCAETEEDLALVRAFAEPEASP